MPETKYLKSIRIKRVEAKFENEVCRFELWLTPNDNSYPQRVKIDAATISDCEGHHNYGVVFEHGSHTSNGSMGGQEKHNEYRWPAIIISKDEYDLLKKNPYFHFYISVGNDKEEHIISL